MSKEGGRSVEEHDIEPFAPNDSPEACQQAGQRGAPVTGSGVGNENGHVDIALWPGATTGMGAERVGELDLR
jgi:hypothetical protein